ncbi:peptidase [Cellulomonas alba]|uniref:Peptidase n=1 Tax=Cellulomonas alba TaxID=3053467 RepID=A0ABT7SH12_9CELL|nr:peptidase [Cellulomonas alba]MDM7855468.1 peptidase [Cellulomonas alba]
MARFRRGALAALVTVLVGLFVAAPSLAADSSDGSTQGATVSATSEPQFGCLGATDSYGAPLPCQLSVNVLEPICDNDVPYLSYAVTATGSPNTTVTITWINPTGQSVVYANLPLTGRVLWPGAVVDAQGNPLDWPGWRQLSDGTWVQGDEFDWVRPSVQVLFKVNPEATVTVGYPPATPTCSANPPGSQVLDDNPTDGPTSGVLAATGSNDAKPITLAALGLVLAGAVAVTLAVVTRRRHHTR